LRRVFRKSILSVELWRRRIGSDEWIVSETGANAGTGPDPKEIPMIALFSSLAVSLALAAASPAAPPAATPAAPPDAAPDCQTAVTMPDGQEPLFLDSFCQADCTQGADVSCSGTSCSAVNQNCPAGQQGYVVCDGNYTHCPTCPPPSCGFIQCKLGCSCPGGVSICTNIQTCECECFYQ
jgi:hypothetical protein